MREKLIEIRKKKRLYPRTDGKQAKCCKDNLYRIWKWNIFSIIWKGIVNKTDIEI